MFHFPKWISRMRRIDWLDGLRGVAILMLLALHVGLVAVEDRFLAENSGFILRQITEFMRFGVQLFFVISAITVSHTLDIQVRKHGRNIKSFFGWMVRRFFRIAPLYYLAIPLYYILFKLLHLWPGPANDYRFTDVLANVAFIHSWIPSANNTIVPGGWTIGCEMNFYVLSAVLVLIPTRRSNILILLSILSAAMLIFANVFSGGHLRAGDYLYFSVPAELPVFVTGLWAFHLAVSRIGPSSQKEKRIWGAAALLGIVLNFANGAFFPDNQLLAPTFMGIFFTGLVALQPEKPSRLLMHPVLRRIGNVSYSIYILHFAVLSLLFVLPSSFNAFHYLPDEPIVRFLVAFIEVFAISYLLATLTRIVIELPFVDMGRRLSSRFTRGLPDQNGSTMSTMDGFTRMDLK